MEKEYKFRVSFIKSFKLGFKFAKWLSILFLILICIDLVKTDVTLLKIQRAFLVVVLLPLAFSLLMAMLLFLIGLIFPTKINSTSISSTNYFGFKKNFRWEEIQNFNYQLVSGIPYLVLENEDGKTLWITMLINDKELFHQLLIRFSASKNPSFKVLFSSVINAQ